MACTSRTDEIFTGRGYAENVQRPSTERALNPERARRSAALQSMVVFERFVLANEHIAHSGRHASGVC
jgi:hypothetical protein